MVDCRTKSSFDADTQPWRELACSIMLQASNDYLECLAQRTTVDPELLMNTLQSRILGRKE